MLNQLSKLTLKLIDEFYEDKNWFEQGKCLFSRRKEDAELIRRIKTLLNKESSNIPCCFVMKKAFITLYVNQSD